MTADERRALSRALADVRRAQMAYSDILSANPCDVTPGMVEGAHRQYHNALVWLAATVETQLGPDQ